MNAGRSTELPHPSPLYMVDVSASHQLTEGVLAALLARATTGKGQEIKVTMVSAIMEMQVQELTWFISRGRPAARRARRPRSTWSRPRRPACTDGHLALAQVDLNVLSDVIGEPRLGAAAQDQPSQAEDTEPLKQWRDDIYDAVAARLATEYGGALGRFADRTWIVVRRRQ